MVREGVISAEQWVGACLERVRDVDDGVQAWTFLDPEHALAQARAADEIKMSGGPIGPLHGVPVGLKDIIDTADMPTENGSVLHAGRTPSRDATVVAMLRAAGAVIMGKTVTTEFATRHPGKTRGDRPADRRPRWRREWCRWRSGARRPARRSGPRPIAACTASSPRTG